jgi:ribonuclease Z
MPAGGLRLTSPRLGLRTYGHLSAAQAAALAAKSDVKLLVLTHISGRYTDEEILAEATRTFLNSRIAADFDRVVV